MTEDLRYPIGRFTPPGPLTTANRSRLIGEIESAPAALRRAVSDLDERQLDTPYRPGGWTVRQVVHHVPDSHLNAYTRFKLGLTEDTPTIRTYEEKAWAELPEARTAPIGISLDLLDALHDRWVRMLRAMDQAAFSRRILHPEIGEISLNVLLALYAWHGRHHVAHVTALRNREGWH